MKTYTIATINGMLLATVPAGHDIEAAVREECERIPCEFEEVADYATEEALILTDEEPQDRSRIVYRGHSMGFLMDEAGKTYEYAIRAIP